MWNNLNIRTYKLFLTLPAIKNRRNIYKISTYLLFDRVRQLLFSSSNCFSYFSSIIRTIRRLFALFADYSYYSPTIRTIRRLFVLFADYSHYSPTIRTIRQLFALFVDYSHYSGFIIIVCPFWSIACCSVDYRLLFSIISNIRYSVTWLHFRFVITQCEYSLPTEQLDFE